MRERERRQIQERKDLKKKNMISPVDPKCSKRL